MNAPIDVVRLDVLNERVECTALRCSLSVASCAAKHLQAAKAWRNELSMRAKARVHIGRGRGRDRGEYSPYRTCEVGAENARRVVR